LDKSGWRYLDESGVEQIFVFEPGTKINPRIAVEIASPSDKTYVYSFAIANAPPATQRVARCYLPVALPTRVDQTPLGWEAFKPIEGVPRAGWFVITKDGGVLPGAVAQGFQLQSPNLPGVADFNCGGNTNVPSVPEDLPEEIRAQLDALLSKNHVIVPSIGPAIPRLNDAVAVLLPRIAREYRRPLLSSSHTERTAIVQTLDEARVAAESDPARLVEILSALSRLLTTQQTDAWSAQLASSLAICVQHVFRVLSRPR